MRTLDDLVDADESAWPDLVAAAETSAVGVRVLEPDPQRAREALLRLQVTTRSVLGALAFHCGGIVVDHGWLRVLGGGSAGLADLASVNGLDAPGAAPEPPPYLIVAFDVVGGCFAVDGGGLNVEPGGVCYWGPDTLSWTGLGVGHGELVHWALDGAGLGDFYASLRWDGWKPEVESLALCEGVSICPPPFASEGRRETSRRPVPFVELLSFYGDAALRLGSLEDGPSFGLRAEDSVG